MSYLLNEIFYDITKFLPNDDIADLMLLSRNFNALVTPRLKQIDKEMATMNQSIKSFISIKSFYLTGPGAKWITDLNLKRFEPIGSKAKKQMKRVLENEKEFLAFLRNATIDNGMLEKLKEKMSFERFDDRTFIGILDALVSTPKFRQDYNISLKFSKLYTLEVIQLKMNRLDWVF
ncbi:hypothetical protein Ddc_17636 [Ditylenchus destructor]|nr:hypothetical protein Ddc_17636 [Ditylenchus destructor]